MNVSIRTSAMPLVGIGLYTPAEAGRLLQIEPTRLSRWLQGHSAHGVRYERLWAPQVDLGEDGIFLGFRDLQEARVAAAFIAKGLSPQQVRQAINLARDILGEERPLSTTRFRTDGRSVFLQIIEESGEVKLIDLLKKQFAFKEVLERSLTNVEYDQDGIPARWWPMGKAASIVLDPARSFGQPIEVESAVPVEVLTASAAAEGSPEAAARVMGVSLRAIRRALAFEREMPFRPAA